MPYIRTRGNQLLLVHGFRDEEGKVNQQVLFTIFSKPEALEILGERKSGGNPDYFKYLIEEKYPSLKFDWPKLKKTIKDQMKILPDLYQYKQERVQNDFQKDMTNFLRQLVCADPQSTLSSAQIYQNNQFELEFIAELIEARLFCAKDQQSNDFNGDNPFYWRQSLSVSSPHEVEEMATYYLHEGEYDRAEAIFKLLISTFENYAEGHNYLGLIAMAKGDLELAAKNFKEVVSVGRKKFPKKIPKNRYWNDLDTRPYMRGLKNLSLVLNRLGQFDDALEVCEQLEHECGDKLSAAQISSDIYLNKGEWKLALTNAKYCINLFKNMSFNAAFALLAMGDTEEAKKYFLHATLNYPYTAHVLIALNKRELKKYEAITPEEEYDLDFIWDLKANIFKYLAVYKNKIKNQFGEWLISTEIQNLIFERAEAVIEWRTTRQAMRSKGFKKMTKMGELDYAEKIIQYNAEK